MQPKIRAEAWKELEQNWIHFYVGANFRDLSQKRTEFCGFVVLAKVQKSGIKLRRVGQKNVNVKHDAVRKGNLTWIEVSFECFYWTNDGLEDGQVTKINIEEMSKRKPMNIIYKIWKINLKFTKKWKVSGEIESRTGNQMDDLRKFAPGIQRWETSCSYH